METIRTFIALEIPAAIRQKLAEAENSLKASSGAPVKWVEPETIHLTLKFLGETETAKIDGIYQALLTAIPSVPAPKLEVKGLGVFPNADKTQVVWAGVTGDLSGLTGLQQAVETALEPLGFPRERRRFSPHLTLGRVRDRAIPAERAQIGKLVTATEFEAGWFIGRPVHLIKSVLTRQGPVYTQLASFNPAQKL